MMLEGNCAGLGYGDVPLFKGTFLLPSAESSVADFEFRAELCVPFEETCRIMDIILETHWKVIRKEAYH